MKRQMLLGLVVAGLPLLACSQLPEEGTGSSDEPLLAENGLSSNGLSSNGLSSNALSSNALSSNALSSNGLIANMYVLTSLRDTTSTGTLTRMFYRYLVGCALPAGQTVTYTWTDTSAVVHTEVNPGSLGLAPGWQTSPPTQADKEIVSACLGARTNSKGIPVAISMRANGVAALAVSAQERATFTYGEGSFWGNLFGSTPYMFSCSRAPYTAGIASSQYLTQGRTCAAGDCGVIKYVGRCLSSDHSTSGQACYDRDKANNDWSTDCFSTMYKSLTGGASNVITTWLQP